MRPGRGVLVWTALAVCAVLVVGAMVWLTRGVLAAEDRRLEAERERSAAENRADLEERTRLALWRMDALGAAIMLRENQVAPAFYQSRAAPAENPEVLLHFEIGKGSGLGTTESGAQGSAGNPAGKERIDRLRALLAENPLPGDEWALLNEAVDAGESQWQAVPKDAAIEQSFNQFQRQTRSGDELRREESYQALSNVTERAQRAKAVAKTVEIQSDALMPPAPAKAATTAAESAAGQAGPPPATPAPSWEAGPMRAIWLGGELFLLRKVSQTLPGPSAVKEVVSTVQGVWLDSKQLSDRLLREAADLLPHAKLVPAEGERAAEDPLAMVSFPFRLERGELPGPTAEFPGSPTLGAPLWIAWSAVALAVITSTLLVSGIMRLSERRASFVSAVTHELRTPLTTFKLYSDMLESGAVKSGKRGDYLRVLSREADRLSHLVENVLAFSRIERGNARSSVAEITTADLLEQSRERLEARLATAEMVLEMDRSCRLPVRVDTAAVDHILFNLIDNAAKYAAGSQPPVVHITAQAAGATVEIIVSDHGPGIAASECGRIFRAFHKSAREAAESRPGVGLGLALSRRLARSQGGDLRCEPADRGARFVLTLPLAKA